MRAGGTSRQGVTLRPIGALSTTSRPLMAYMHRGIPLVVTSDAPIVGRQQRDACGSGAHPSWDARRTACTTEPSKLRPFVPRCAARRAKNGRTMPSIAKLDRSHRERLRWIRTKRCTSRPGASSREAAAVSKALLSKGVLRATEAVATAARGSCEANVANDARGYVGDHDQDEYLLYGMCL